MVHTNIVASDGSQPPGSICPGPSKVGQAFLLCQQTFPSQSPAKGTTLSQSLGRPACCTCDMSLPSFSPLACWASLQPPPFSNPTFSLFDFKATLCRPAGMLRGLFRPRVFGLHIESRDPEKMMPFASNRIPLSRALCSQFQTGNDFGLCSRDPVPLLFVIWRICYADDARLLICVPTYVIVHHQRCLAS